MIDLDDPTPTQHDHRIYGNDHGSVWASVSEEDYQWAIKWRWCPKRSPCGKLYLRRAVGENANNQRLRTYTLYLHVEILKRKGDEPASEHHNLVDHLDGDSLNCRRDNLRWATRVQNNRNRFGSAARQGILQ